MAKYDLTDSLETEFTFAIGDKEFKFRKPTVIEMRSIARVFGEIEKEENPEKQAEKSDEAMAELYKFVESINHDVPLKDVLDNQTVGVQIAFNEMIKKELGAN